MESVTGQNGENVRDHVGNNSSKAEPEHVLIRPWMVRLLLPKSFKNVTYSAVSMTHIYDESCIEMHNGALKFQFGMGMTTSRFIQRKAVQSQQANRQGIQQ